MKKQSSSKYKNDVELIRLMRLVLEREFKRDEKITESKVESKISTAINRLKGLRKDMAATVFSTLSKVDNHLYGKPLIQHLITKRYLSGIYRDFFVENKTESYLYKGARHIANELQALKDPAKKFQIKQDIHPVKLDQYAVFAGFEGFKNAVSLKFIPNPINVYKSLDQEIKDFLKDQNIDNPKPNANDPRLVTNKTDEEFLEQYSGFYNVIFIEEDSTPDNIKFGISSFIIQENKCQLWFMEYGEKTLCLSDFEVVNDINRATYYLREIDSVWGFIVSFKRLSADESNADGFYFPYLGVKQVDWQPFAGLAYALKVDSKKDLVVPVRMMDKGSLTVLKSCDKPISTQLWSRANNKKAGEVEVYQEILDEAEILNQGVRTRIVSKCESLIQKGCPSS